MSLQWNQFYTLLGNLFPANPSVRFMQYLQQYDSTLFWTIELREKVLLQRTQVRTSNKTSPHDSLIDPGIDSTPMKYIDSKNWLYTGLIAEAIRLITPWQFNRAWKRLHSNEVHRPYKQKTIPFSSSKRLYLIIAESYGRRLVTAQARAPEKLWSN